MQHMAQFVYDMYTQKINFVTEKIEEEKARIKDAWVPPDVVKEKEPEEEKKVCD